MTARWLQEAVSGKTAGFIDSDDVDKGACIPSGTIVLGTSPCHYPVIRQLLERAGFRGTVVTVFDDNVAEAVKFIVESQPRSGTHYTLDGFAACTEWVYASVFRDGRALHRAGGHCFAEKPEFRNLIDKTHFTRTLHYPEFRYTLFLLSYFFDSYYSWGRQLAGTRKDSGYVLHENSKEWRVLKGYIPLHKKWLGYVQKRFHLRYEVISWIFPGRCRD